MKNIIITFLGIFLLSATMNAAAVSEDEAEADDEAEAIRNSKTYCVELPGHDVGNSGWTKRDNHIGVLWVFSTKEWRATQFATVRGNWEGQTVPDRYLYDNRIDGHIWYSRGDRPLCVNYERLSRDVGSGFTVTRLRLVVKYGDDCAEINLENDAWYHARMKIVKKSGDLVNPWSCKRI